MKCMSWALACAISGAVFAGHASAQTLRQPLSVKPVAFNYDYYADEPVEASPSDQPAPAAEAAPAAPAPVVEGAQASADCGCNTAASCCNTCGGTSCGCGLGDGQLLDRLFPQIGCCEAGEPWTLMGHFDKCGCWADKGWTVGGFTQFGYQNNPDGAFCGNGPFLNQKEWNNLNLNQQYMYIGKAASAEPGGIGLGFRADLMFGADGNEGQSFGNINPGHYDYLNGWDHGIYEWALPQLYGEVALGEDWLVKVGHFYTIVGYEVVPSNGNFFLSRQLNFWNSEPFTHTGVLASYKVNDKLTLNNGWVLGWDTGYYQFNQGNAYLGGFTYTINDKTSFIYAAAFGNFGWRGTESAVNSWILTRSWTDRVSTVHQFDVLGSNLNADFADPTSYIPRDSTGFINYLFYEMNSCVKAGTRLEWYKADGTSYNTLTGGFNVKASSNLLIRPEIRYMWSPGNQQIYTGSGYSGELFNQTVFGIDAIMSF